MTSNAVVMTRAVMPLEFVPLTQSQPGPEVRVRVDAEGGAPLRCCLRDSRPGERIALITVTPEGPRTGQEEAARQLLSDPRVAFVQTRNIVFGCYMLTIRRA
jgi:hypothetical protein